MASVEETELAEKLELSVEDLRKKIKKTYFKTKRHLEQIGNNEFLESLKQLDYKEMIQFDEVCDDIKSVAANNDIGNRNIDDDCFMCLCGKKHLKNLHIFNHEQCEDSLVIGSSCIKQIAEVMSAYKDNEDLYNKIQNIINKVKDAEKILRCNKCLRCDTNWCSKQAKGIRKYFCKDCIITNWKGEDCIHCIRCNKTRPIKKTYEGYALLCMGCWKKDKGYD